MGAASAMSDGKTRACLPPCHWLMGSSASIQVPSSANVTWPTMVSRSVAAIASRTGDKAERAAKEMSIPKAYGSYEELLADEESTLPPPHPKLRVAKAREADVGLYGECLNWLMRADFQDEAAVKRQLKAWVPEYQPESTGA